MVTDGILDALPVGEQDILLETIIQGSAIVNPKEMSRKLLLLRSRILPNTDQTH